MTTRPTRTTMTRVSLTAMRMAMMWMTMAVMVVMAMMMMLLMLMVGADDAIMPSSPHKLWPIRPRGGIEPLHVPMSLDLKSSPDPSRNHGGPLTWKTGGYQQGHFRGGSGRLVLPAWLAYLAQRFMKGCSVLSRARGGCGELRTFPSAENSGSSC